MEQTTCRRQRMRRGALAAAAALWAAAGLAGACLPPAGAAPPAAAPAGAAADPAPAPPPAPPITTEGVRTGETDTGDTVADAILAAGSGDFAFLPAAAFKPSATVPRPATGEQMALLLDPSTDQIVVLHLRGSQVLSALERSVSFAPQASAGFLQVSGIAFTYDPKKDSGKRVGAVTVGGKPLEAAKTYKVATTRPLANGQQGYFQIWDKDAIAAPPGGGSPKTLATALADLARTKGGTLSPSVEGRIAVAGAASASAKPEGKTEGAAATAPAPPSASPAPR